MPNARNTKSPTKAELLAQQQRVKKALLLKAARARKQERILTVAVWSAVATGLFIFAALAR